MKIARFESWACSKCGYVMSAAWDTENGESLPSEGDLAICVNCAEPHILDRHRWRALTDDELIDLSLDMKTMLSQAQIAVREHNKK
jgi:hypothetical protein